MDHKVEKFLEMERKDPRPLIISGCLHGVTESWGFKNYLTTVPGSEHFNIIARWSEPVGPPKIDRGSLQIVGVELQVEEISQAVLLLIHHTKLGSYRQRFGSGILTEMQEKGYLEVREDPRFWNIKKTTEDVRTKYEKLLKTIYKREKIGEAYPDIVEILRNSDREYQKRKMRHLHQNWNGKKKKS